MPLDRPKPQACRTLFLSDLHLGALGSRSDLVLDLLTSRRAETYVLVGDILDLWQPLLPLWTASDQAVIDHLNARQRDGATLQYLRGNHDPDPTGAPPHARVTAEPLERLEHLAADGRRFLVLHGDQADGRLVRTHLATRFGSLANHLLRRLDDHLQRWRAHPSVETRSLIEGLLVWLNALSHVGRGHERVMVALARDAGLDGVICGHFHIADLHGRHGLIYANCGDWMDSFTALEERHDGTLHLVGGRASWAAAPSQTEPEGVFA